MYPNTLIKHNGQGFTLFFFFLGFAKTSSILGVCLISLAFFFFFFFFFFFWGGGGGNLSGQVFLGGTEQMLGPSLCSRKSHSTPPPPWNMSRVMRKPVFKAFEQIQHNRAVEPRTIS